MKTLGYALFALGMQLTLGVAYSLPPDQVHNSAVPPIQEPQRERAARETRLQSAPAEAGRAEQAIPVVPLEPTTPSDPSPGLAADDVSTGGQSNDPDGERAALWASPAMREARDWVMEYARRSAQSSESEGREFLLQLSHLSATDMQNWLERYRVARTRRAGQQNIEASARRLMLEQAMGRQDQTRQAFDDYNRYRSEAATWMGQRLQMQSQMSQHLSNRRSMLRDQSVRYDLEQDFDPFLPIFDPSTPRGLQARQAAAATLPGDLPRSDPRNFLRGDEGFLTDNQGDNVGNGAGAPDANTGAGAGAAGGGGGVDSGAGAAAGGGSAGGVE
jgi:hypothetical protein